MDAMMKNCITEKDLLRQILLLEQLANHQQATSKELALILHTTERTIFSDIVSIRQELPPFWQIVADSNGLALSTTDRLPVSQIWELFFPKSIGISLLKALLFSSNVVTQPFLLENGISLETLRRHTSKLNQTLASFSLRIRITAAKIFFEGSEINLRLFYHRLLLPYTHNNYFFHAYSIHENHYYDFLKKLDKEGLHVDVEQIFGTCWFFINTIRIKANCPIDRYPFDLQDTLFALYQEPLKTLYKKEGVYLETNEHFFSFYCFLESWNYNNLWTPTIHNAIMSYTSIFQQVTAFVARIEESLQIELSQQTKVIGNLALLLIKLQESAKLSEKFQLEYQDIQNLNYPEMKAIDQMIDQFILQNVPNQSNITQSIAMTLHLLIQQARLQSNAIIAKGLFVFQGEPAWKIYLFHELKDYFGRRISLETVEPAQLGSERLSETDFILSNFPLEVSDCPTYYLSMVPTKNELNQLTELIQNYYLNFR